jgi:Ca2+-binding RTX toxin-like protein
MAILLQDVANGVGGFVITTESAAKLTGFSVSSAGDFNGDGFGDFLVLSPNTPSGGGTGAGYGRAYIVYGGDGLGAIDLSDIAAGVGGVMIQNDESGKFPETLGFSGHLTSFGDVNGDGFSDVIIAVPGAVGTSTGDNKSGEVHVVFGTATPPTGPILMSDIQAGNGGFTIFGGTGYAFGHSVAAADINGDGFDDVLIGQPSESSDLNAATGRQGGRGWVVFGEADPGNFDVSTLVPPDPNVPAPGGFIVLNNDDGAIGNGTSTLGTAAASAGDFNGDGLEDIAFGDATNAMNNYLVTPALGTVHVLFGTITTNPVDTAQTGLTIVGEDNNDQAGWALDGAGDMNGDGYDDLVIGARFGDGQNNATSGAGDAYVVFGRAVSGGTILLDDVAQGIGGFAIRGVDANDNAGYAVAGIGDFNADGFDDIVIGAFRGDGETRNDAGEAYVVYGKATGFGAQVLLADIAAGNGGFVIRGHNDGTFPGGAGYSVDGAGDVNDDGFDDILIGVPGNSFNGRAYVVYGFATGPLSRSGTNAADRLFGGDFDDSLSGGLGDDTLDGRGGNDTLNGGADDDLLNGGTGADAMQGGGGSDTLNGGAGNDTVNGGTGTDAMTGGSGNDTFYVDNAGDSATEAAGEGIDTVSTTRSWQLSDNVENLIYTGAGNFSGVGNAINNTITGGAGNDTIEGGGATDVLQGGAGTDTASYASAGSGVKVSLAVATGQSTGGAGTDTLSGFENLLGSAFNDQLTGDGGNNVLTGDAGNDTLTGGAGNDTMNGGGGSDTASYVAAAVGVTVSLATAGAQNTVGDGIDTLSSMDNLTGSAFGDTLTGNDSANTLTGGAGDDTLNGGVGGDRMDGGFGNDHIFVDSTGDQVVERAGEGTDTVTTTVGTFKLGAAVENLIYAGAGGFTGTGNALDNVITGGSGNDLIDGDAGNDTLTGGVGTDTLTYAKATAGVSVSLAEAGAQNTGGSGSDTVSGFENLIGSKHVDSLTGDGGANVLKAGDGNDVLDGGTGADAMQGGAGNDAYTVDDAGDTVFEKANQGTDTVSTSLSSYTLGANVENLVHVGAADFSGTGNTLANSLTGGIGADILSGGGGLDQLIGGLGDDTFIINKALVAGNVATVVDFAAGSDVFHLALSVFTAAGSAGTLSTDAFHVGSAAHDTSDRIIYNAATGALLYDSDGTDVAAAKTFAMVGTGLGLSENSFQLV